VKLPASLTIRNSAACGDGGTVALSAIDESNNAHSIVLIQHAFAKFDTPAAAIPGRLYFDGQIVDVRSTSESTLLDLLKNEAKRVGEGERETTLQHIIDRVASVEYVAFAAIMDEMRARAH
jgi:hypothetical protein